MEFVELVKFLGEVPVKHLGPGEALLSWSMVQQGCEFLLLSPLSFLVFVQIHLFTWIFHFQHVFIHNTLRLYF